MINKNTLDTLEALGFGADVDALESYVENLQDAAGMGNPLVTDTVYDQHFKLLRELKPDSVIVNRNWEADDNDLTEYDVMLTRYGMSSINTIQNMADLYKFKEAISDLEPFDMVASAKLNGHAIRAVYVYGELKSGSTRGRYKRGRDITRHLKATLPNTVPAWSDIKYVEVRGEMLVSLEKFNAVKHILKTPLSAVTSFIRESVTDAELSNLSCVCYKVLPLEDEKLAFNNLTDELDHLENNGFLIPPYAVAKGVAYHSVHDTVEKFLEHFETLADSGELVYATDGIVAAVNDLTTFYSLGKNGNTYLGNFAIKMGKYWESNVYSSTILEIEFIPGKSYITPKAIIEPVITVTGAEVSTVPLYNIRLMDKLNLIPGNTIYFKFGGETGVSLVDEAGTPAGSL